MSDRGDYRSFSPTVTLAGAECSRCALAPALPDDTLCAECRAEIDAVFADQQGTRA